MLSLVDVARLKVEPRHHWRRWAHAARCEADHTFRESVLVVVGVAHATDHLSVQKVQHLLLGYIDARHAPTIKDEGGQDVEDDVPEHREL